MHALLFLLWQVLVLLEENLAHSGYRTVPSSILLGGVARRVEAHFAASAGRAGGTAAEGNFGPWGVGDWVLGTGVGRGGGVEEDVRREIEGVTAGVDARGVLGGVADAVVGGGGGVRKGGTRRGVRGRVEEEEEVEVEEDEEEGGRAWRFRRGR